MNNITELFLSLFFLFFPFQIRFIVFSPHIFSSGNFNAFGSVFIYLADIFLLLAFISYLSGGLFKRQEFEMNTANNKNVFITILSFILICWIWCSVIMGNISILFFLKAIEVLFIVYLLSNDAIKFKKVAFLFIIGALFQIILAFFQFEMQRSVGLRVLGEPIIGKTIAGVAKIDFSGNKYIRTYGTFLHPNILSAYFLFVYLGVLTIMKRGLFKYVLIIGSLLGIVLTFSRMTILVTGLISVIYIFISIKSRAKYCVTGVGLASIISVFSFDNILRARFIEILSDGAVLERLNLLKYAFNMIYRHPIGVGVGNFTSYINTVADNKLLPWDYQPVHNAIVLMMTECGVLFGIFFIFLNVVFFIKLIEIALFNAVSPERSELVLIAHLKKLALFLILVFLAFWALSLNDHYFYTSCQGNYLIAIFYGLGFWVFNKFKLLPLKKS